MKVKILLVKFLLFVSLLGVEINDFKWDVLPSHSKFRYVEDFYSLYYVPLKPENSDFNRNIFWLKWALAAPFAPPIFALSPPKTPEAYEKYKTLMRMHLHYLVTKNLVFLAARFDKHEPVFYNKPFAEDILKSLGIAEYLYLEAAKEWKKVLNIYRQALKIKARTNLNFLEQAVYRIRTKELDYDRVIKRKLKKLARTKKYFS